MIELSERENGSRRVAISLPTESRVEQAHTNAVDINSIVRKYRATGYLPDPVLHAVYGDFSGDNDFHTIQSKLSRAREQFLQLPADIRTLFKNDPALLIDFVNDPNNQKASEEMGLLPRTEDTQAKLKPAEPPKPAEPAVPAKDEPDVKVGEASPAGRPPPAE